MLEVSSIFLSIALLIFFAYRGFSVLLLAPFLALTAVFLSGDESLLAHYTQIFMVKLGDFVTVYFPLFLLSAIFGKIMESSGSARSIAEYVSDKMGSENAILAVVLSCSVLTYGGVSLFVVAFAVYPIAVALFRKSDTPKRLIPGAIALGSFTFTMVAFPGTPAIQNAIPAQYFGTNTFAAPGIGFISGIIMFALGMLWLKNQLKTARKNLEGYGTHDDKVIAMFRKDLPRFWVAISPVIIVILMNYLSVKFVFPNMDTSYLEQEKYGVIDIKTVASNWAIIISVFFALTFLVACHYKKIDITKCLNTGAVDALVPIFNTASVVGYGAVINSLPGFAMLRDGVLSMSSGNPLISGTCVTGILSAVTGSASGGLSISLEMMGAKLLEMANSSGIAPEILHRIICLASSTLHALPHNGAIITLLVICGLSHRDSYKDIFVIALLNTCIATIAALVLYGMLGVF
ncbi:MAG: GntP family permease [Holosporaceae bacterium]|jgi:H+/gluconate symporter-like permease|nr:GntP family permease [Holosporaceae bacterium]